MTREEAWKQYYDSDPSLFDGGLDENDLAKIQQYFYDGFDSCASELKQENAELKEKYNRLNELKDFTFETYKGYGEIDVKELVRLFESRGYRLNGAYKENIKVQNQLAKAKQIIKDLLADNTDWTNKLEAEQFLKEE